MDEEDTWENGDQGEFRLNFGSNGGEEAHRPRVGGSTWNLTPRCHDIDGLVEPIRLSPDLDWDQPLVLYFEVLELDTFGGDYRAYFAFVHPHDMSDVNSWKRDRGRDFSATSDDGKVKVYWWVVLEDY